MNADGTASRTAARTEAVSAVRQPHLCHSPNGVARNQPSAKHLTVDSRQRPRPGWQDSAQGSRRAGPTGPESPGYSPLPPNQRHDPDRRARVSWWRAARLRGAQMFKIHSVLIVCATPEYGSKLAATVAGCGMRPVTRSTVGEARAALASQCFSIMFCEDILPDGDFRALLKKASELEGWLPVIVVSRTADWDAYLTAIEAGAFDCIACTGAPGEVERIIWSALGEARRMNRVAAAAA
jgi:hypothetical protein